MRIFAALLAACFLALCASAQADEIRPSDNVVSGVVIRAAPTTQSERLGLLSPNEALAFINDRPNWYEVRLADGRRGFVSKRWTVRIVAPEEEPSAPLAGADAMYVHFVYVGQGAGAILEFPCGVALIDTGGQYNGDTEGARLFNDYLDRFFAEHPQYRNTIDVVFTSHPHQDHLDGLPRLLEEGVPRYRVLNVVDNGQSGSGQSVRKQMTFRNAVLTHGGAYAGVSVTRALIPNGLANAVIDPIPRPAHAGEGLCEAGAVNPDIRVLWGGWTRDVVRELGGRGAYHSKPNNHSLVIRIDFGEASFLFTGDLEIPAIGDMLEIYPDDGVFDVDVYHVGHHGAENATTADLLAAMTPEIAII